MYDLPCFLDIKDVLPSLFEKNKSYLIINILANFRTVIIDCIYLNSLVWLFEKYLARQSKRNTQAMVTYRYALQKILFIEKLN